MVAVYAVGDGEGGDTGAGSVSYFSLWIVQLLDYLMDVILTPPPTDGPNQAMGLSFSVRSPTPAPPSLQNIYKSLHHDYPSFTPPPNRSGLLTPWASRGVLMLNACLTVVQASANSHSGKGWEALTQKVIEVVAKRRTRGVVFMAWGSPAGKRVAGVEREKGRHCVLKSVHPSPLSAHKGFVSIRFDGFLMGRGLMLG